MFAQVMTIITVFLGSILFLTVATRFLWRLTSRKTIPAPRMEDDRLQRLEEAVDTIAVEIERMSEAQRFTAKLLLERGTEAQQPSQSAAKLAERIVTPR
jgi:hypothetical protein